MAALGIVFLPGPQKGLIIETIMSPQEGYMLIAGIFNLTRQAMSVARSGLQTLGNPLFRASALIAACLGKTVVL